MLNNIYNVGSKTLANAQVGVSNTSNNIANAGTEGYKRTSVVSETSSSITVNGLATGTGADITAIQTEMDSFVEAQYLDASSEYEACAALYDQLSQAETILDQSEDSGLNALLDAFWGAWSDLAADPASESAREALLGTAETLVYELRSLDEELDELERSINDEIADQVVEANALLEQIATLNVQVAADPQDLDALYARDLAVEKLAGFMDITVDISGNGMVTVFTAGGTPLVQDAEHNELVLLSSRTTEAAVDGSTWEGELGFSGQSSEEILLEFVSSGPDGAAQFRVSYDNGATWASDADGSTLLYTASSTQAVELAGVEITFDGTGEHAVGDRFTVTAKSGLYVTTDGGDSLKTLTPLTDASGEALDGRLSGGSLSGLFTARDDVLAELQGSIDALAGSLIYEVNVLHSQGAGLEHHTAMNSENAVADEAAPLEQSGLEYAQRIVPGEIALVTYDANGETLTRAEVSVDPSTDSLNDVAAALNAAFGGELTATVEADGTLSLAASGGAASFEVAGDETGLLAALGLNTFFSGSDAGSIGISAYAASDVSHVNCQAAGDDGRVSSGGNATANALAALASQTVVVGETVSTLGDYLSTTIASVGAAVSSAELRQDYADASLSYYAEQRESVSGVNTDEELINLTRYQEQFEMAAKIISAATEMFDTVLEMG